MPYAHNGHISQDPIEGGIVITQAQYAAAVAGICDGLEVTIIDGFKVAAKPDPVPKPVAPPTAEEIKAAKWEVIKAERDRRKAGGVKAQVSTDALGNPIYKWFHSDADSRIQQLALVMFGASVPPIQWKTMDGSFVGMTQTLANQIFQAAAASDQAIFGKAEEHRAAMETSADPANYDFSTGWPLTFGE